MVTNGNPAQQGDRDLKGRFVPGQSGNPNGSPKKPQSVSMLLRELVENNPEKILKKWQKMPCYPTGAMLIAKALFTKMGKGDITAIREGLDRVEGKVKDTHEISGENGGAIKIVYEIINGNTAQKNTDISTQPQLPSQDSSKHRRGTQL